MPPEGRPAGSAHGIERTSRLGRVLRRIAGLLLALALGYALLVAVLTLLYTFVTPVSTLMIGNWLTARGVVRTYMPLTLISPHLPQIVVAAEDQRYCQHAGVDWDAVRDVVEAADEGGVARGASTIAMQTAKNLFLWPGRSYVRKVMELPIALWLDFVLGKRRLMEIYLNIAEWDEGVFGAEAAARRHFGKAAKDLSRREAALLVAVLPNPITRDAGKPSRGVRARAQRLQRIADASGPLSACIGSAAPKRVAAGAAN